MLHKHHGSITGTGASASMRGKPLFAAFASAKTSLRSFTAALAHEVAPHGIHVVHVVIDSMNERDRTQDRAQKTSLGFGGVFSWLLKRDGRLDPADVATTFWEIHAQPPGSWTHEIDRPPYKEYL